MQRFANESGFCGSYHMEAALDAGYLTIQIPFRFSIDRSAPLDTRRATA